MKTTTFLNLIESAVVECYGEENASQFDSVPYLENGESGTCVGIFLTDAVHMASVAAQAMLLIDTQIDYDGDRYKDKQDFVLLMQLFRIAPYMQWTCVYFPGIQMGDDFISLDSDESEEEGSSILEEDSETA